MEQTFNISVHKTEVKQMSVEEALEATGIQCIDLPTNMQGKLKEVSNGFFGSVKIRMKSGILICLPLMQSKFGGSGFYIPQTNARASSIGEDENVLIGVGNVMQGRERSDGQAARSYATLYLTRDILSTIKQYVATAVKNLQVEPSAAMPSNSASSTGEQ